MSLAARLGERLIERHPERAAAVLERAAPQDGAGLLAHCSAPQAAGLLQAVSPRASAELLVALDAPVAGRALDAMDLQVAARLVRRVPEPAQERLLESVAGARARAVRALLRFPASTAGAWMDPEALALPGDLSVRESLRRLRQDARDLGYYLYVVDRRQQLVGVLTLRELLLARPRARLSEVMTGAPLAIAASADGSSLLGHPGWKRAHELPVVDNQGIYLGAVRYHTLRALEAALLAAQPADAEASQALGELLAAGAAALLDALSAAPQRRPAHV
jgi:magnesium transporter